MKQSNRRQFLKIASTGAMATMFASMGGCNTQTKDEAATNKNDSEKLKLGMASYTFRKFSLNECLSMTKRLGVERISLKSFHLPLESSIDEIKAVAAKVKDAGIDLYGCGVVYMKNEVEVHRACKYAKRAGMKVIIGVPEHHLLNLANEKVKEFDIKLAIHNHGPGDQRYPSPQSAYEKIKNMDARMGLCIDIGHTKRIGIDPSVEAKRFADRLHDVHVKDVSAATKQGKTVEIGRGVIDIPKFLRTLVKIEYKGAVSLEFEKDENDPLAGAAESIGYLRGVLDVI